MATKDLVEYLTGCTMDADPDIRAIRSGRVHADGTPCKAATPETCPFEHRAAQADSEITGEEKVSAGGGWRETGKYDPKDEPDYGKYPDEWLEWRNATYEDRQTQETLQQSIEQEKQAKKALGSWNGIVNSQIGDCIRRFGDEFQKLHENVRHGIVADAYQAAARKKRESGSRMEDADKAAENAMYELMEFYRRQPRWTENHYKGTGYKYDPANGDSMDAACNCGVDHGSEEKNVAPSAVEGDERSERPADAEVSAGEEGVTEAQDAAAKRYLEMCRANGR